LIGLTYNLSMYYVVREEKERMGNGFVRGRISDLLKISPRIEVRE
jgi:hypothetical protein